MDEYFCYWDAKTNTDLIIIIVNQTIVTTILAITLLRMPKLYRLYRRNIKININNIILIHALIVFWGIAQSAVNYYSITVSLTLQKQVKSQQMIQYSQTYALLSSFPGYTVQTLFITICFTFCRNIVRETDIRIFPSYSIKFVFVLKIYYIIRLVVWFLAILLLLFSTDDSVLLFSKVEFISLINDSVIINIFIFLSIRIFINRLNPKHFRRLKIQYLIMFSCSICRIIVDSVYVIIHPDNNFDFCVSQKYYRVAYTIVYNIIGNYLIHFTPISIILKIYYFDHRKEQEQQKLIPRIQASIESQNQSEKQPNIN